ncbi:hypothetical protein HK096_000642, partial [Nowakowskiella sp. JEL0078]
SVGSFISLASATFDVNYTSAVIGISGFNLTCLVSLSSMFVSFACMFVYLFPAFLGISPSRHPRISRVEVVVDFVYIGFWLSAASALALFGRCPQFFTNPGSNSASGFDWKGFLGARWGCLPWNLCLALGYVCAILHVATFTIGVNDLQRFGWGKARSNLSGNGGEIWTRGTWKQWIKDEK